MKDQKKRIVFSIGLAMVLLTALAWMCVDPQVLMASDGQSRIAQMKSEDHAGHKHSESESGRKQDDSQQDDHAGDDHAGHDESHKNDHSGHSHGSEMEKGDKKSN